MGFATDCNNWSSIKYANQNYRAKNSRPVAVSCHFLAETAAWMTIHHIARWLLFILWFMSRSHGMQAQTANHPGNDMEILYSTPGSSTKSAHGGDQVQRISWAVEEPVYRSYHKCATGTFFVVPNNNNNKNSHPVSRQTAGRPLHQFSNLWQWIRLRKEATHRLQSTSTFVLKQIQN